MTNLFVALSIVLQPDAVVFSGKDAEMANAFCLGCHSADYVTTQPPKMGKAFWKGVVIKMKDVYGAPIPDQQIDDLADFFSRN